MFGLSGGASGLTLYPCELRVCVCVELYFERGNAAKFTTLVREFESAGTMTQSKVRQTRSLIGCA